MSSAFIIIDLIEDIVGQTSANHQQVAQRDIISLTHQAVLDARQHKTPVVWVSVGFADDYHDCLPYSPLFQTAKQQGRLRLSQPGSHWVEGLDIHPEDHIIIKKGVSAFAGNTLHDWLSGRGYEHLFLAGVSSAMAIESTARQAHDLGYQVTVFQDLCAASTLESHQQSMKALTPFATITDSNRRQMR